MSRVRTIHWGTGAMGSRALRLAARNPLIDVVGVVSQRSVEHGCAVVDREAPELASTVVVGRDLDAVVERCGGADVLLLATHARLAGLETQMRTASRLGLNVICIAEDSIFPWAIDREIADRLDQDAMANGISMVGTGANPGFLMDYLPLVLTAAVRSWRRLRIRRMSSLDPYGDSVLRGMGVGLTTQAFDRLSAQDEVLGHLAFEESMGFLSEHLGLQLEIVSNECTAIVRAQETVVGDVTLPAGVVVGLDQRCVAVAPTGHEVTLEHPQVFGRAEGEEKPHDLIELDGTPPLRLRSDPGIDGGAATVGLMVNLVPAIVAAAPGLHTMAAFPLRPLADARRAGAQSISV